MIGQTLGHYRILEKVGAGGMGVVYRARDEQLDRDVAVKVLPPGTLSDDAARRHFRKEAMALAKLNHPNIETVYEFGSQDGMDFLVMEYVPGKTLADRLTRGTLPEKEVIALGIQIAAALEEAHERGIVHRDLKPANIAITAKGRAKILDFGLAKLLRPVSEGTTEIFTDSQAAAGTLPYMPPEQLMGDPVDARADIYTIGAVLYEMATDRRAFPEELTWRSGRPLRVLYNKGHSKSIAQFGANVLAPRTRLKPVLPGRRRPVASSPREFRRLAFKPGSEKGGRSPSRIAANPSWTGRAWRG